MVISPYEYNRTEENGTRVIYGKMLPNGVNCYSASTLGGEFHLLVFMSSTIASNYTGMEVR
jgi:hypothetical protein